MPRKSLAAAAAGLLAFALFAALAFSDRARGVEMYTRGGLYAMILFIGFWLRTLWRDAIVPAGPLGPLLRRNAGWIALGVALAAVVFVAVPPFLRVVSDETNLLGIGRTLATDRKVLIPADGIYLYKQFYTWTYTDPDRPLLFPMLLFASNAVFGYHYQNAFAINFILLAALLAAAGAVAAHLGRSRVAGLTAVTLLLAQPMLAIYATSAGYDLLNLCVLALAFTFLARYARRPNAEDLCCTWVTLLAAAHIRPESGLFFVVIFGSLLARRKIPWEFVQVRVATYCAAPLCALPALLAVWLYSSSHAPSHQIGDPNMSTYGLEHLRLNTTRFLAAAFDFGFYYPYAPLVSFAALAGLVVLVTRARRAPALATVLVAGGLSAVVQYLVICTFWGGNAQSGISTRYFLPLNIGQTVVLMAIACRGSLRTQRLALGAGLLAFAVYFPVAWRGQFMHERPSIRKVYFMNDFLARDGREGTLAVVDYPGRYTSLGYGAVTFDYFNRHEADILAKLRTHLLQDVFFVQELSVQSGELVNKSNIDDPDLVTDLVVEHRLSDWIQIRVSRLRPPRPATGG